MRTRESFYAFQQRLNLTRRSFLKRTATGIGFLGTGGLVEMKYGKEVKAFAYEPYPKDDECVLPATVRGQRPSKHYDAG